jgi:hypothetical protein
LLSLHKYVDQITSETNISKDQAYAGLKKKRKLSSIDVQQIADNLGVHIKHLVNQTVDYDFLQKKQTKEKFNLPKRFLKGTHSSTTSLNSVLSEFEQYDKYYDAIRYLQIDPALLEEHKRISIVGIYDVLKFMSRYLTKEHLTGIAQRNADKFLETDFFGNEFYNCLNTKKPAEALFENIHKIERNWDYNILKSGNNKILIETSQTEEMLESCPDELYTDSSTVKIRYEFIKRVVFRSGIDCEINQLEVIGKNGQFKFELIYNHKVKQQLFGFHQEFLQ